jgi:hypothetical protein
MVPVALAAALKKYMQMTTHGTRPMRLPKTNDTQLVRVVVWLCSSMRSPNRFMAALRAKIMMALGRSYMPDSSAMMTIMTEELSAYSNQRM